MKICSEENCNRKMCCRGLCTFHYQRLPDRREKRYAYNKVQGEKTIKNKKCKVIDCSNPYLKGNYCQNHYDELVTSGLNKKESFKKYYYDNTEKMKRKAVDQRAKNPEKTKQTLAEWKSKNKDKTREYARLYTQKKMAEDINFRIKCNLRKRIGEAVKGKYKSGSAVDDLGCSIEELRNHLEAKFQAGMNWDNWGVRGWHIDHIIPLDSFDLSDREQLLKACHYSNLQPLWAIDNIRKSNKI